MAVLGEQLPDSFGSESLFSGVLKVRLKILVDLLADGLSEDARGLDDLPVLQQDLFSFSRKSEIAAILQNPRRYLATGMIAIRRQCLRLGGSHQKTLVEVTSYAQTATAWMEMPSSNEASIWRKIDWHHPQGDLRRSKGSAQTDGS